MRKRVLIVHAHPEKASFCSAIKDATVHFFESNGAEVKVSSLYEMGFDPVGGKHDFTALKDQTYFKYQLEQVHAEENGCFVPEIRTEMDKFIWADTVIFNFPSVVVRFTVNSERMGGSCFRNGNRLRKR
jgi:NAD(P)H dehydrogenase (quinone)